MHKTLTYLAVASILLAGSIACLAETKNYGKFSTTYSPVQGTATLGATIGVGPFSIKKEGTLHFNIIIGQGTAALDYQPVIWLNINEEDLTTQGIITDDQRVPSEWPNEITYDVRSDSCTGEVITKNTKVHTRFEEGPQKYMYFEFENVPGTYCLVLNKDEMTKIAKGYNDWASCSAFSPDNLEFTFTISPPVATKTPEQIAREKCETDGGTCSPSTCATGVCTALSVTGACPECCKCKTDVEICTGKGGTCGCTTSQECKTENKITTPAGVCSTCCKCTAKTGSATEKTQEQICEESPTLGLCDDCPPGQVRDASFTAPAGACPGCKKCKTASTGGAATSVCECERCESNGDLATLKDGDCDAKEIVQKECSNGQKCCCPKTSLEICIDSGGTKCGN